MKEWELDAIDLFLKVMLVKDGYMNEADIHEFCVDLNSFFTTRFNYNPNYRRYCCRVFINKVDVRTPKYTLTLSWRAHDNKIAITAISFEQEHAGHGTALLSLLISLSKKYGYERIEFISVCTEPMQKFVEKYGFDNHSQQKLYEDDSGFSKDWSKSIEELTRMEFMNRSR
jgi:tRNA(Ile)-lysidine synthase TilS/MesJ